MRTRRGLLKSDYLVELTEMEGSVSAGGSVQSDPRELPHLTDVFVVVEVNVTFDGSASVNPVVELLCSMDGTNFDTEAEQSYEITVSAGSTVQKTFRFEVGSPYYRLRIRNPDSVALTVNSVKVIEYPYRYVPG